MTPLPTYGLTHLAVATPDVERAFEFYNLVFGMVAVFRQPEFLQAQTPGARDVLVFERSATATGDSQDIAHFGFRLKAPEDIATAGEKAVAQSRR